MARTPPDLPDFLYTVDAFSEHLDKQFEGDDGNAKGSTFLEFACRLVPFCEFWSGFDTPKPSSKTSHDKGVDFWANSEDGAARFCGQSKYKIKESIELDAIFSKFRNYEDAVQNRPGQQTSIPGLGTVAGAPSRSGKKGKRSEDVPIDGSDAQSLRYVIVTSSNLSRIRALYEESRMGARAFYQRLVDEKRLEIIDANDLLPLLQSLWRKSFVIAPEIELELQYLPIKHDNTYLSVISARTLRSLYKKHGSSLFFENIRDFLGAATRTTSDRDDVNGDIVQTLTESPERMLGRNNGITLKADSVVAETDTRLRLANCSIVNGCQTTMCIVHAGAAGDSAMVVVKIVLGQDSWDVAKAANYQNRVTRIELELAKFLRPQLVRKAATELSYAVPTASEENTVSNVLEAVYKQKLSYDSLRYLYIGLFSRVVSNLISSNYSALRFEILNMFYRDGKNERLMRVLFLLLKRTEDAADLVKAKNADEKFAAIFRRFFDEHKAQYRCVLAILAACGCVDAYPEKSQDDETAYIEMSAFIDKLEIVLEGHVDYFNKVFSWAFTTLAMRIIDGIPSGSPEKISQSMHSEVVSASGGEFPNLVLKLRMQMNNDDFLTSYPLDLSHVDG